MKRKTQRIYIILALIVAAVVGSQKPGSALIIDSASLIVAVNDVTETKDITKSILKKGNGKIYFATFHDLFPDLFKTDTGDGFNFVQVGFEDTSTVGVLDTDVSVRATTPGENVAASLDIKAHWDCPGGNATQYELINGSSSSHSTVGGKTAAIWSLEINPYIGEMSDKKTSTYDKEGHSPIYEKKGPQDQFLAGRVDYRDDVAVSASLPKNAQGNDYVNCFAGTREKSEIKSSLAVPEASSVLSFVMMIALGGLAALHRMRK